MPYNGSHYQLHKVFDKSKCVWCPALTAIVVRETGSPAIFHFVGLIQGGFLTGPAQKSFKYGTGPAQ